MIMETMSETTNQEVMSNEVVETKEIDYKALYEKAQQDIEKIAAKKDELYKETKKAKQERELAAQAAQKAAEEKALKDGEFEKLWQTAKKEKEELMQALSTIKQANRNEKIQISAMKIATELADGNNAELLSEFVARNIDKMADETGALSADVLEAIRNDFKGNQKFQALLRSSKAVGGGAIGNAKTVANDVKELSFSELSKMSPEKRLEFSRLVQSGKAKLI